MSEGRKPGTGDVVEEIIARQMNEVTSLLTLEVVQVGGTKVGTKLDTPKRVSARAMMQGLIIANTLLNQRMELVKQAVVRHQAECGLCRLAIRAKQGGLQGPVRTHDYQIVLREDGHAEVVMEEVAQDDETQVVQDNEAPAADAAKEVEDGAKEE